MVDLLVIHAYVDFERIGQIHIQRLEERSERRKIYSYKIVYPKGFKDYVIKHRYDDGWKVLLEKVLKVINRKGQR